MPTHRFAFKLVTGAIILLSGISPVQIYAVHTIPGNDTPPCRLQAIGGDGITDTGPNPMWTLADCWTYGNTDVNGAETSNTGYPLDGANNFHAGVSINDVRVTNKNHRVPHIGVRRRVP